MSKITIYGASDDLVEIEGDFREEFYVSSADSFNLAFGDGTVLDINFDRHGIWRINRVFAGSASFEKLEALGDEGARDDGTPAYSEVVKLSGDLQWVSGSAKATIRKISESR